MVDNNTEQATNNIDSRYRRLDSVARLIELTSTCSAIMNINDRFLITSNNLSHGTRQKKNKLYINIVRIMKYFQNLALNNVKDDKEKIKLFEEILSSKFSKSFKYNVKDVKQVINYSLGH
jgi:hypothetical protein